MKDAIEDNCSLTRILTSVLHLLLICDIIQAEGDSDGPTEPSIPFRDLICYQCSGQDCPAAMYNYPVSHLVLGCQSCYKQWDTDHQTAIRKCSDPSVLREHNVDVNITDENVQCGIYETDGVISKYCYCYTDYCNHGNHIVTAPIWRRFMSTVIALLGVYETSYVIL